MRASLKDLHRFNGGWSKDTETGCWNWGRGTYPEGYGRIYVQGRRWSTHRLSYTLYRGDIPDGFEIDHLCGNRSCCNPDHLEPVTHKENVMRGKGEPARFAKRTHCDNGHEFTPENTMIRSDGGARRCYTCKRARERSRG